MILLRRMLDLNIVHPDVNVILTFSKLIYLNPDGKSTSWR